MHFNYRIDSDSIDAKHEIEAPTWLQEGKPGHQKSSTGQSVR